MKTITCPRCTEKIDLGDEALAAAQKDGLACPACGMTLDVPGAMRPRLRLKVETEQGRICPSCKTALFGESTICGRCGYNLKTGVHSRSAGANEKLPKLKKQGAGFFGQTFNELFGGAMSLVLRVLGVIALGVVIFYGIQGGTYLMHIVNGDDDYGSTSPAQRAAAEAAAHPAPPPPDLVPPPPPPPPANTSNFPAVHLKKPTSPAK